jgi:hypothetical protein
MVRKTSQAAGWRVAFAAAILSLGLGACQIGGTAIVGDAGTALRTLGFTEDAQGKLFEAAVVDKDTTTLTGVRFTVAGIPAVARSVRFTNLGTRVGKATFERMEMDGLVFTAVEGAANASVDRIVLTKPDRALAAFVVDVMAGRPASPPPMSRVGFDTLQFVNALAIARNPGPTPEGIDPATLNEEIRFANLGFAHTVAGKSVQTRVQGMRAQLASQEGPPSLIEVADAKIAGLNIADFIATTPFGALVSAGVDPDTKFMAKDLNPIDPGYDSAEVIGLRFNILGVDVSTPLWTSKIERNRRGVAISSRGSSTDLTLLSGAGGLLGGPASSLTGILSLQNVKMAARGAQTYDAESDRFGLDGVNVASEGLFEASVDLRISGWGAAQAEAEKSQRMQQPPDRAIVGATSVEVARITFIDKGIVAAMRARALAASPGAPPEQVNFVIGRTFAEQFAPIGINPDDSATINTFMQFAQGGKTLEVAFAANRPVSFAEAGVLGEARAPPFPVKVSVR